MCSQIAQPQGLITMHSRTPECSARSASLITSWYQSAKFWAREMRKAVFIVCGPYGQEAARRLGGIGGRAHPLIADAILALTCDTFAATQSMIKIDTRRQRRRAADCQRRCRAGQPASG